MRFKRQQLSRFRRVLEILSTKTDATSPSPISTSFVQSVAFCLSFSVQSSTLFPLSRNNRTIGIAIQRQSKLLIVIFWYAYTPFSHYNSLCSSDHACRGFSPCKSPFAEPRIFLGSARCSAFDGVEVVLHDPVIAEPGVCEPEP